MTSTTPKGRVSFIGAGPGAADLITLRGARRIAEADIVVWAASLVTPECIHEHARSDAELVDSSRVTHEDAIEIYRRAERERLKVARVHSGDPSLWGAVQEQYDGCARMHLDVEIVPGVAAFSAAAAAAGRELTIPEVAQSVVLTRLEGGKTPMPSGEKVRQFAEHGTTMALFLSAARTGQLVEELRAGGYTDDVPVLVAYKVTWPDELMLRTTIGELEATVKQHKLWRHTLFLVGWALTEGGTRSHLYNPGHFHTFRRADPTARRALRAQRSAKRSESNSGGGSSHAATTEQVVETERTAAPASAVTVEPEVTVQQAPQRSANRPDPDVAWWAVRDWQQSARESTRAAAARPAAQDGDDQPELFVAEDAAQEVDGQQDASAEPEAAEPEAAEPEAAEPELDTAPAAAAPTPEGNEGQAKGNSGAKNSSHAKGKSGGTKKSGAKSGSGQGKAQQGKAQQGKPSKQSQQTKSGGNC